MLFKLNQFRIVQNSSVLKKFFHSYPAILNQQIQPSFSERMEKAMEERIGDLKTRKQDRFNAKKEKYDGRSKRRKWEHDESEEAKRLRLEESGGERIKRRKALVLLGYSGVKYCGMQRNLGIETIEEELLKAMLKQKWINDLGFQTPQQLQFQRAARTDKGVSACRQVVSLKMPETVDIDEINKDLPSDIKIFAVKRVTKGFNSKSTCDARTYSYTLPTYALTKHDEEFDENTYRLPPERHEELNKILNLYEGTKNFHNFTIRKEPNDPSCRRYMMKLDCPPPFIPDNSEVEFAKIKVKGQSFMMHQIRRMVGLVIAIMRGHAEPFTVAHAMERESMNIPQAPGLGLVLEKVHYERYNKKYGNDGMHEILEFKEEDPVVEEFYQKNIVSTIISTELNEKPMLTWIKKLKNHSFTGEAENNEEDNNSGNTSD